MKSVTLRPSSSRFFALCLDDGLRMTRRSCCGLLFERSRRAESRTLSPLRPSARSPSHLVRLALTQSPRPWIPAFAGMTKECGNDN